MFVPWVIGPARLTQHVRRDRTVKSLRYCLLASFMAVQGCLLSPDGPVIPIRRRYPEPIQGTDGSSYDAPLRVGNLRAYPDRPVSQEDEAWLRREEDEWIYAKYCNGLGLVPSREMFQRIMHHNRERHGRTKRVYDVVTLTVPGTLTNVTYFDVTRFTHVWPRY
jgi:hypothetical protein